MNMKIKWNSRATWVGIVTLGAGLVEAVFDHESIRPLAAIIPLLLGGKVLGGLAIIFGRAGMDPKTASK